MSLGSAQTWRRQGVLVIILLAVVLLVVGASVSTFKFNFKGAITLILSPDQLSTSYSVISLGIDMPYKTVNPNAIGIRFLQVMYFVFSLVFPLLFLLILTILWSIPLKLKD